MIKITFFVTLKGQRKFRKWYITPIFPINLEQTSLFPRIGNQYMNRNLKIVAGFSKAGKLLTFHTAGMPSLQHLRRSISR